MRDKFLISMPWTTIGLTSGDYEGHRRGAPKTHIETPDALIRFTLALRNVLGLCNNIVLIVPEQDTDKRQSEHWPRSLVSWCISRDGVCTVSKYPEFLTSLKDK